MAQQKPLLRVPAVWFAWILVYLDFCPHCQMKLLYTYFWKTCHFDLAVLVLGNYKEIFKYVGKILWTRMFTKILFLIAKIESNQLTWDLLNTVYDVTIIEWKKSHFENYLTWKNDIKSAYHYRLCIYLKTLGEGEVEVVLIYYFWVFKLFFLNNSIFRIRKKLDTILKYIKV